MFIYLIQLASVSMYSHHTDHRFHGWLNPPSRPNSTDNSPARYGLCNPLRLSCVLGATPERIGFEIFEDQCSNWHDLFLTQMSPFFVTLLYGDASRAGDDDDDQQRCWLESCDLDSSRTRVTIFVTCDLTWTCKEMTCYQRKSKATPATQGPHKFLK